MSVRVSDLMGDYFDEGRSPHPRLSRRVLGESATLLRSDTPIRPVSPNWEIVSSPNRFMKTYEFDDFRKMHAFLNEVLEYQEQVGHHGKITVDHREIIVEVYTHDVNDVTELDQEYVRSVDAILQDVQHYFLSDEAPIG